MDDLPERPVLSRREFHDELQVRLRAHRERVAPRVRADLDGLLDRHGFLTDDAEALFNRSPAIVTFPVWVAAAVGFDRAVAGRRRARRGGVDRHGLLVRAGAR